jgi:hypothetical protein
MAVLSKMIYQFLHHLDIWPRNWLVCWNSHQPNHEICKIIKNEISISPWPWPLTLKVFSPFKSPWQQIQKELYSILLSIPDDARICSSIFNPLPTDYVQYRKPRKSVSEGWRDDTIEIRIVKVCHSYFCLAQMATQVGEILWRSNFECMCSTKQLVCWLVDCIAHWNGYM